MPAIRLVFILTIIGGPIDLLIQDLIIGGKWVARYNNTSEYNKEYDIWQYTESGTVDGVGSGMDVNILLSRPCSITGHQYEFYQLVSKSTTTINGKATYKCKTCGHIKTTDIAKKLIR